MTITRHRKPWGVGRAALERYLAEHAARLRRVLLALALCVAALPARAQEPAAADSAYLRLELPILDLPYNVAHGGRAPSMAQALAVSESFYELSHRAIERLWGGPSLPARLSIGLFDSLAFWLPGGDAWLHEEFHRAVLGHRGIDSFNDVYRLEIGASAIAVSHVADEDLVRLKAEHPAEQVRLGAAGMEGEYLLLERLQRNAFYWDRWTYHPSLYWVVKVNTAFYVWSGHTSFADELTDRANAEDGSDVSVRDFTGHDFTAWVYDLHRPDEPYTARGVHPSGVGIDRYVKASDLTDEERSYLKRQGWLQLLNFLDPGLLGRTRGFVVGGASGDAPVRIYPAAGHLLTSFGDVTELRVLAVEGDRRVALAVRRYSNGERSFPGVEGELLRHPVRVAGQELLVSPRVALWLQPEGQRFRSADAVPGGLAAVRAVRPISPRWGAFAEVEAKTAGWAAGRAELGEGVAVRVGGAVVVR